MGRWGDGEMGRWGDGEMRRWLIAREASVNLQPTCNLKPET
ncbi:hypothetical protein [Moorena producens]